MCDGEGLGLTVNGVTPENKQSKNLVYLSKVSISAVKYWTNRLGKFLNFLHRL
jgi:hypothetical protein